MPCNLHTLSTLNRADIRTQEFMNFGQREGGSYIGIGWEVGRAVSKTDWYQDFKENYWYPYRLIKFGY